MTPEQIIDKQIVSKVNNSITSSVEDPFFVRYFIFTFNAFLGINMIFYSALTCLDYCDKE